jgi:hypothetical protein
MPSRGPRPSLVRTHSRSSSGGSSKLVYNLQLTHKDPVVQSKIDKARRTSHTFEVRHCFPNIKQLHCIIRTMLPTFRTYYPSIFLRSFFFGSFPSFRLLTIDLGTAKSTGECLANWEYCTSTSTGAVHRSGAPSFHASTTASRG